MAKDSLDEVAAVIATGEHATLFIIADAVTSAKIAEAARSHGWSGRTAKSGELMVSFAGRPDKSAVAHFLRQITAASFGKAVSMRVGAITEPPPTDRDHEAIQ